METYANGSDRHSTKQSERLIFAYKTASILIVLMGVSWGGYFVSKNWWPLAFADLILAAIGAISWMLLSAGKLRAALMMSEIAFLVFAIGFCLLFDVPTDLYPRVSHLFLLALAMLGYLNYIRRPSVFQIAIIAACLCAFVAFSSANLSFPFAHTIPDEIRLVGTWINSIAATVMLCGCVYALQLEFTRHRRMAAELRAAVRNGELELFFQPQIDRSEMVIGAEALLRWKHPQRGYIAPGDFISIAEEIGLMPLVGGWVLDEACRTLVNWKEDGTLGQLTLAINVSPSEFEVEGFEHRVLEAVEFHRVDARKLKLELTESVIISGVASVVSKMDTLRGAGIAFALDDFGTGYSSLSYLRRLPIQQLKIDRSFVNEALESKRGATLVRGIVQIGLDLGLDVLAEGIETEAQHAFMLECGCREFQGFYFSRPIPRKDFEDYARKI